MGGYLSKDLRKRVVDAVSGGSSRRAAGLRFGVSAASAVRWVKAWRQSGRLEPQAVGGDHRSGRIEGYASVLLETVDRQPDVTLAELQALLRSRGASFGIGTLWRFFDRRGISFKKKRARQRARPARRGAASGAVEAAPR